MVDIDRRSSIFPAIQAAGLRRLSTRASTSSSTPPPRNGLQSLSPLAAAILSHLRASGIQILPGLSPAEFARIEAEISFTFPPDLRTVLSSGLPYGPGFPDWRSIARIRASIDLPIAAVSLQIASGSFWPRSSAYPTLPAARSALRRAPILIPLFDRCYIPCKPTLAGNPIFFVDETRVVCCGFDLPDFFRRDSSFRSPDRTHRRQKSASYVSDNKPPLHPLLPRSTRRSLDSIAGKTPRWIEFWTDSAASNRRRCNFSSDRSGEIQPATRVPEWVGSYLNKIGSVLKDGGWGDSEVSEMVDSPSTSGGFAGMVDDEAVIDTLVLKADRCSDSLMRAGWSSDEISDALCFDFRRGRREIRAAVNLPPLMASKMVKLAEAVSQS